MAKATSLRLPPNGLFEIELTAGVWTNVTADVDQSEGAPTLRAGRTSEFSAPQVAEFSVALRNFNKADGTIHNKYQPQNTGSPYYPNIQPRKRIRYSWNAGVQRFRFTGYINQWQPLMVGALPYMQITAADRMDQLGRVSMLSPIRQEITLDDPVLWWPLTDDTGSTQAAEQSGSNAAALSVVGTGNALVFGDSVAPASGDGTTVHFAGGWYLTAGSVVVPFTFTAECWFFITAAPGGTVGMVTLDQPQGGLTGGAPLTVGLNSSRNVTVSCELGTITSSSVASVGGWHHVALTRSFSAFTASYILYLDGVSVGTLSGAAGAVTWRTVTVGQTASTAASGLFTGNIGQVAVFPTVLSSTRIQAHAAAGFGYFGDRTDVRISRFLGYAGLTSSDWNLDTGQVQVNTYPQDGRDVLSACQDIAATEGGGAALYVTGDGKVRFVNRRYRDTRTPKLIIDALDDLDPGTYQPSYDSVTLINQEAVARASAAGTQTTQTYQDAASLAAYGLFADQATTYTVTDQDALALAQYDVTARATPALRFPQIAVDLAKSKNDLYDAVAQLQTGDRIRLKNIPAAAWPVPQVDFFFEGANEAGPDDKTYVWVADVTAADNPPRAQWDVSQWDTADAWAL